VTDLRVAVVDDDATARRGLCMMLDAEPDMAVVGEGADGREALGVVRDLKPHVLVMDLNMPGVGGLEATRLLATQGLATRVVLVTIMSDEASVYEALRAGASGFLLKDSAYDLLATAVRVVAAGDALLDPGMTRRLIGRFSALEQATGSAAPAVASNRLAALSPREHEVLELVALGLANYEIAGRLNVGETTVKTHVSSVLAKLGLRDRVQAVILAYETGLVVPGYGPGSRRQAPA